MLSKMMSWCFPSLGVFWMLFWCCLDNVLMLSTSCATLILPLMLFSGQFQLCPTMACSPARHILSWIILEEGMKFQSWYKFFFAESQTYWCRWRIFWPAENVWMLTEGVEVEMIRCLLVQRNHILHLGKWQISCGLLLWCLQIICSGSDFVLCTFCTVTCRHRILHDVTLLFQNSIFGKQHSFYCR